MSWLPDFDAAKQGTLVRFAGIFYAVLAAAGLIWMAVTQRLRLDSFIDREHWHWHLLAGVAGGLALLLIWTIGRRWLSSARLLEALIARVLGPLDVLDTTVLAILSGVSEEILFRGAVQGSWGIYVASVLFALLHTGPGRALWLWGVFALVAGLIFGALELWSGNLLAPIIAHVLVNAVNLRRLARLGGSAGE